MALTTLASRYEPDLRELFADPHEWLESAALFLKALKAVIHDVANALTTLAGIQSLLLAHRPKRKQKFPGRFGEEHSPPKRPIEPIGRQFLARLVQLDREKRQAELRLFGIIAEGSQFQEWQTFWDEFAPSVARAERIVDLSPGSEKMFEKYVLPTLAPEIKKNGFANDHAADLLLWMADHNPSLALRTLRQAYSPWSPNTGNDEDETNPPTKRDLFARIHAKLGRHELAARLLK